MGRQVIIGVQRIRLFENVQSLGVIAPIHLDTPQGMQGKHLMIIGFRQCRGGGSRSKIRSRPEEVIRIVSQNTPNVKQWAVAPFASPWKIKRLGVVGLPHHRIGLHRQKIGEMEAIAVLVLDRIFQQLIAALAHQNGVQIQAGRLMGELVSQPILCCRRSTRA